MGVDSAMRHRHALTLRRDDLYETPAVATHALVDAVAALGDPLPERIWEPACGRGAISRVLIERGHKVASSDLVDYGFGFAGRDFLLGDETPPDIDAIVTNPPYKLASQFAAAAIRRASRVCMLLRLAFLEAGDAAAKSQARRDRAFALDGGQLRRVIVFANRLPMMHRDGWTGPKANSGSAFAWFCWDRTHRGPASLHRWFWRDTASVEAGASKETVIARAGELALASAVEAEATS